MTSFFRSLIQRALWMIRKGGLHGNVMELRARMEQLSARMDLVSSAALSRVHVLGHTMYVDPTDTIISRLLIEHGIIEIPETELMFRSLQPGDVVLDIGANIGYYTLLFARLVGETGRVYAFEPDPTNFALLQRNIWANRYRNVVLVQKAVTNVSGPLSLFLAPGNKGDHRIFPSGEDRRRIEIEGISLDDYFRAENKKIDFVKIDIQGSEGAALAGMRELLKQNYQARVLVEIWPWGMERFGTNVLDVIRSLKKTRPYLYRVGGYLTEAGLLEGMEPVNENDIVKVCGRDPNNVLNIYCSPDPIACGPVQSSGDALKCA